jgi:hypothetical protein
VYFTKASKESLKYFNDLSSKLQSNIIKFMLGVEGNTEKCIYDSESEKCNFYDFCKPEFNTIIEYHGERYHPNPNKLLKEEWDSWTTVVYKANRDSICLTADEKHELDKKKKQLAESKGFDYIELWSSDSKEDNWKKINNVLT